MRVKRREPPDLTQESLKRSLSYSPDSGIFTRVAARQGFLPGTQAGYSNPNGYVSIRIAGSLYQAHRLAWLYMTGSWPAGDIDHISGDPSDNRWGNLRDVSHVVNLQNQRGARRDNKVGLLGVHRHQGKFRAYIGVAGSNKHLGMFDSAEAAHEAYLTAKRALHSGCTI